MQAAKRNCYGRPATEELRKNGLVLRARVISTVSTGRGGALEILGEAVKRTTALRRRRRLQSAGGEGEEVFSPTFAGSSDPEGTIFSPHPVVVTLEREDGPCRHLDLLSVLTVVQRWRQAILSKSNGFSERTRELLSGHKEDGTPLDGPHLAFLPLAFVGHQHADGRLLGMGLALPADVSADDRRQALRAITNVRRLLLGRLGIWKVETETSASAAWNLRPEAWTAHPRGATHWATVTPVAFDRHPKTDDRDEYQREVARMIATACARIGLAEPREVIATQVSAHVGVPPSVTFPKLRRRDGTERRHTHVILVFDRPVQGPVLIGAGRYRGYGVCRPLDQGGGEP